MPNCQHAFAVSRYVLVQALMVLGLNSELVLAAWHYGPALEVYARRGRMASVVHGFYARLHNSNSRDRNVVAVVEVASVYSWCNAYYCHHLLCFFLWISCTRVLVSPAATGELTTVLHAYTFSRVDFFAALTRLVVVLMCFTGG